MPAKKHIHWSFILVVTMLFWSTLYVFLKLIDEQLDPLILAWARFFVATIVLLPLMIYRKELKLPEKTDMPRLLLIGLIGSAIPTSLLVIGVRYASVATTSIIINANVLLVALLAPLLIKEKTNSKKIIGVMVGMLGVIIVIVNGQNPFTNTDTQYLIGSLLVFVAAISVALFAVYVKKEVKKYDGTFVTFYSFLAAIAMLTVVNLFTGNFSEIIYLPPEQYLWLVLIGILATALPFVIWNSSVKYIGSATASSFKLLIPVFATIFAVVFFKEELTIWIVVGLILTLGGVAIVNFHHHHSHHH